MYGAMIGDLAGFPLERRHVLPKEGNVFLPRKAEGETAQAGEDFSDKLVLTAGLAEGLLCFEKKLPGIMAGQRAAGNIFEEAYTAEIAAALRRYGQASPLAGYPMELSIWLFREGTPASLAEDASAAARVSPVAWMFQEDLYMMRHLARVQTQITHRGKESVQAADAAACAVFLAIHGCTKDYIRTFMDRTFGYGIPDPEAMQEEILHGGGGNAGPALCVRAALTAFLYGTDFEDVLRRAAALGGPSADIAAIAGAAAEAFFGIPDSWKEACRDQLPEDIRRAADAFTARMEDKKKLRETDPRARVRWENALTRASERHPAAVQGNEALEEAIAEMLVKRDRQSFAAALEMLRLRMDRKGRVFVPVLAARRAGQEEDPVQGSASAREADPVQGSSPARAADLEQGSTKVRSAGSELASASALTAGSERRSASARKAGQATGSSPARMPENSVVYRLQAIRTRDGRLWQPAYTSRSQLDKAGDPLRGGMVLSYAMEALLKRFLPLPEAVSMPENTSLQEASRTSDAASCSEASGISPGAASRPETSARPEASGISPDAASRQEVSGMPSGAASLPGGAEAGKTDRSRPEQEGIQADRIEGVVLNPYDKPFFLTRKTIEVLFALDRRSGQAGQD